ncbi:hypothetical protein GCM10018966_047020 [Streptomyces yanii]
MECFGDEFLGQLRAVVVGGVDQGHAAFHRLPQHRDGILPGAARPPVTRACQLGRAETEPPHRQLAPEQERIIKSTRSIGHNGEISTLSRDARPEVLSGTSSRAPHRI